MWQQSSLTWPDSAQAIQSSAVAVTNQIGTSMNSAAGRLTSLESDAQYGRHSLSESAQALLKLRGELESLLVKGTVLSVSPYQFQVGTKFSSGAYLNPQTATKVLVDKLRDHADKYKPAGSLHCVGIMLTASQIGTFTSKLNEVISVFPLPEWCQIARQAQALTTNEVDKYHQPAQIVQPRFKPMAQLNADPLRGALSLQGSQIATLESLAHDKTNVIGKLQALGSKRAQKLSDIQSRLLALHNLKSSVWAFPLQGTAESIATQLSTAAVPNNHQFTVASLMLSHEPLTFWEELLC